MPKSGERCGLTASRDVCDDELLSFIELRLQPGSGGIAVVACRGVVVSEPAVDGGVCGACCDCCSCAASSFIRRNRSMVFLFILPLGFPIFAFTL